MLPRLHVPVKEGDERVDRLLLDLIETSGPPVVSGHSHDAGDLRQPLLGEFIAYRDKAIDNMPGPVTLSRAWYHCAGCGHGFAPLDTEFSTTGTSLSPGLAAMNDTAAAAGPFAKAPVLL